AEDSSCSSCELQMNLDLLRQINFFSTIPIEKLKIFAYLCTRKSYAPDEEIFSQGEDDGQALLILRGQARLVREHEGRTMEIRTYEEGEFLGGLSLLSPMRRLFTLQAATDLECLILTRGKFERVLAQMPELTTRIFKVLVERLRTWDEQMLTACADGRSACQVGGISLI
ncbi:MAG: cyclic nucleotide-binding domain-containing protein, partial [Desulfobacterales bacterium]